MLGEAAENVSWIKKKFDTISDLRDRFETDFGFIRSEQFTIPKKEGKWDSFTTNRPSTDANKIINVLASAKVKISIPLTDEDKQQRVDLSTTERFVYGCISLRDNLMSGIPEALPLQSGLSWHAPIRGWIGLLCYFYEKDDGKNGKVCPHIAVWDILNTAWASGYNGLVKAGNMRYASPEEIKDQYKEDLKPDNYGRVVIYDIWDKDEHGVIGTDGANSKSNGYLLKPEKHGLDHVPALILPGGSTPLVQSKDYTDTIKNVGESVFVNNRNLFEAESRMGTYLMTFAGRAAKTPMAHEWDSTKGGNFPALEGNPFEKGSEIPIDIGKGEKMTPLIPPELTRDFFSFQQYLLGRLEVGGQAPVSFGQISQALPAAGINILRHASMENIKPPQKLMERAYQWLAHELVSQYKNGKFGKMEIQGIDGSNRKFRMEVEPENIDDSWQFETELITDFPQDDMANVGMSVQLKQAKLLSDQTIRDKYLNVADTDSEERKLDNQAANEVAFIKLRHLAVALLKDGDIEGAQFIMDDIERMKMEASQPQQGVPSAPTSGIAAQPNIPQAVAPSADTTAVAPPPPAAATQPTPNQGRFRRFISRFGGG